MISDFNDYVATSENIAKIDDSLRKAFKIKRDFKFVGKTKLQKHHDSPRNHQMKRKNGKQV